MDVQCNHKIYDPTCPECRAARKNNKTWIDDRREMNTTIENHGNIIKSAIGDLFKKKTEEIIDKEIEMTMKRIEEQIRKETAGIVLQVGDFYSMEYHGNTIRIEVKQLKDIYKNN